MSAGDVEGKPTPDEFVAEMERHATLANRTTVALCVLAGLVLLAFLLTGCSSHRAPDARPAPPGRIEARLRAYPPIGIAGQRYTLLAELVDPRGGGIL